MSTRTVVLASGTVVFLAAGLAIWQWWPILICCPTDGVGCWPVDQAQDCPAEGHIVSECPCPTTLPNGSTECGC